MKPKKYFSLFIVVVFCLISSSAQTHTYKISVIVDTDMALDDIRALAMLLNSDAVEIPLIVTTDGAASPQAGCQNLGILLDYFNKDDTAIAKGKELGKPAPPWRSWSENIRWPKAFVLPSAETRFASAPQCILNTLSQSDEKSLYLCLGPLTNLAKALAIEPKIKDRISRLIYYGGHPDDPVPGWNTDRDPDSARLVFDSGLNIYAFCLSQEKPICFDQKLADQISRIETAAADLLASIHSAPRVRKLLSEGHFHVWDELPVIFMNKPSLFTFVPTANSSDIMSLVDYDVEGVRNCYVRLLDHAADFHLSPRQSVVLKSFPLDPALFRDDVSPLIKDIIARYGLEEWKACLLTNELHRHLGAYSLIGAKMGIRAREILAAPFDMLKVVSFAGNGPPLSCMNDGLQVSTGASLGRGTIDVLNENPQAAASFFYKKQKITLKVKQEVIDQIQANIKAALEQYGGFNPEYFAHFRKLAIQDWLELDRKELFIESLDQQRR